MKKRIAQLKDRYVKAKTQAELAQIDQEMSALSNQDNDAFSQAMVGLAHETSENASALLIRQQLESILPMVSLSYIAKTYFGKSKEWLYQRINGNIVNGRPAKFTQQEIDLLNNALNNMGNVLINTRVS